MNGRMISASWTSAAGAALATLLFAGASCAQAPHKFETQFTVEDKPLVTLQNPSGTIRVKAWNKHEVMIVAQYASANVVVDAEQSDNRIGVATRDNGANPSPVPLVTDYEVTVPVESELVVRNQFGSITVDSVHGDMQFDTVAADVALQDVQGYLIISTVGGSLVCTRCTGRLDATSISGNFQLMQPVMDNVRVHTTSGNIFFDGGFLSRGIYMLKDDIGTIEVRFSASDSFDLNAASLFGNVINQAPVVPDKHRMHAPQSDGEMAKSLFGSMNDGHAKVDLSSFSGTIKILKR